MTSNDFAKQQFNRMSQLDGPPKDSEAIRESLAAIKSADTEEICLRVIDDIVSDMTRFPKPAEIRRMMFEASDRKEPQPEWMNQERPAVKEKNGHSCGFVCGGWGTVGTRPNVRWCTCHQAEWVKREIPDWLELCNRMPSNDLTQITRGSVPTWLQGMPD